jgi:DnaK suppressor protein
MAKTKIAKKTSSGKANSKPKTAVKVPAKKVSKAKPAAKPAQKAKAVPKKAAKPAVKTKVKAAPKPAPARKTVKPTAAPAKKAPAPQAKKAPVAKAAPVQPTTPKTSKSATSVSTNAAPVKTTPAPVAIKSGGAASPTKPGKTANTMSSKETTQAKPMGQKAPSHSATSKNPGAGAGMASPLQAANKGFVPYVMQKGEEYMNDKQKEHFRKILLNWRDELMQEVDRTVHHMQDEAANPPDPADRATLEEEFSLELRTRDRERRLIKKIDSTIELIANDDYGYCDSCGVEIGIRRLEARPTANKCIDCKTLDEIKERQVGSA